MCRTYHWELVHSHLGEVATVLGLVCDQACSRDHVGGHAVSDVEKNVLRLANIGEVFHVPVCGLGGAVVAEDGLILARLEECNAAPGFRGDIDQRRGLGVLGEQILVPVCMLAMYLILLL